MNEQDNLTPSQLDLSRTWDEHIKCEFEKHDVDATLATMVPDPYVIGVPVLKGGVGLDEVREFYEKLFIPQLPPDTDMTQISRTIGHDQIVEELIFKFTHTIKMDWMLPGIPPTGKRVEMQL